MTRARWWGVVGAALGVHSDRRVTGGLQGGAFSSQQPLWALPALLPCVLVPSLGVLH